MIRLSNVFKEIFSRLKMLPYNVYDEVPQEPENPHIRIDYAYELDKSGKNYDCITYFQYIHVFSTYKGRKEVLMIADDVINALSKDIETDEFVAYPHLERNEIMTESDNSGVSVNGYHVNETYRHAVIVYKYTIYKK